MTWQKIVALLIMKNKLKETIMSKIIIDMPNPKLKRRIEWLMAFSWNEGKTENKVKQNLKDMYKENGNSIAESA